MKPELNQLTPANGERARPGRRGPRPRGLVPSRPDTVATEDTKSAETDSLAFGGGRRRGQGRGEPASLFREFNRGLRRLTRMGSAPASGAADCALAVCSLPQASGVSSDQSSVISFQSKGRARVSSPRRVAEVRGRGFATKVTEKGVIESLLSPALSSLGGGEGVSAPSRKTRAWKPVIRDQRSGVSSKAVRPGTGADREGAVCGARGGRAPQSAFICVHLRLMLAPASSPEPERPTRRLPL